MFEILAFSDVHGNVEAVRTLIESVKQKKYEAVIFAGDFASFEDVQNLYEKTMKLISFLGTPCYYVFGNRDLPPPTPTYPTLLGKGTKEEIGEGIFVTADERLVDKDTIYVSHWSSTFRRNAFLHVDGHTHLGMMYKNYLNLGFLYRDDFHGAKPLLGCFWELTIQNREVRTTWHNLGGMRAINCHIHNDVSFYVPETWFSCPLCFSKRKEEDLKSFFQE